MSIYLRFRTTSILIITMILGLCPSLVGAQEEDLDGQLFQAVDSWSTSKGIIAALVEKGANPNAKANEDITPLMLAAIRGNKSAIPELLAAGAQVEAAAVGGSTALMLAAREDKKDVAALLLEAGAKPDARNDNGWNALMYAARNKGWQTLKLFVEKGMDLEKKTPDGWTAVLIAADQGHGSIIEKLLKAGATIPAMTPGKVPTLVRAAGAGDSEVLLRVLQYHPDLEVRGPGGETALFAAAAAGHTEVVMELLRRGVNEKVKDTEGRTALVHAQDRKDEEMAILLGAPWDPRRPSKNATVLALDCEKLGGEVQLSLEPKDDQLELTVYYPKPVSAYLGGSELCAIDPAERKECGFKRFSADTTFYFDIDNKRKTGRTLEYRDPKESGGAEFIVSFDEMRTSVQKEGGGVVSRQVMMAQFSDHEDSLSWEEKEGSFDKAVRDLNRISLSGSMSLLKIQPGQKIRVGAEVSLCGAVERVMALN